MKTRNLELLNKALADELSAIHQYLYFHFHCDDQGLGRLAGLFKKTAISEMSHLEKLAERILFLKGEVEMKSLEEVKKLKKVEEMLALAREMEKQGMKDYNQWANECAANEDAVSKQLFESLVAEEEKHYNQFDLELERIAKFGSGYLALPSLEESK